MAMNPNPGSPEEAGDTELPDDERLPCGRSLFHVWENREAGVPDPHTAACPHCTAALRDLEMLGDVVRDARSEVSETPEADTAALTARVMDVVRLELRPGRTLPLGERTEDAWIVEAAAAKTFRAAVEALPGVRAGSCRIAPLDPGTPDAPSPPRGPVRVRMEVAVTLNWNLRDVAEQVRERVAAAADGALGMEVAAVDVRITDVLDPEEADDVRGVQGVDQGDAR